MLTGPLYPCEADAIQLCATNYPLGATFRWKNTAYTYPPSVNTPCITTTATNGLVYTVTVSQNGCRGTASYTVVAKPSNNPDFALSGNLPSTTSLYYTITATPITTTGPFEWYIEEITTAGVTVTNTAVYNPNLWLTSGTCNFIAYDYLTTYTSSNNSGAAFGAGISNPLPGQFKVGSRYKITRKMLNLNGCPSRQISATIQMTRSMNGVAKLSVAKEEETSETNYKSTTASISENEETEESMTIYPNPTNGMFSMDFLNVEEKNIYIYDSMGKLIYNKLNVTAHNISVDLSSQPKGIYFVNTISKNKKSSKKLIVE